MCNMPVACRLQMPANLAAFSAPAPVSQNRCSSARVGVCGVRPRTRARATRARVTPRAQFEGVFSAGEDVGGRYRVVRELGRGASGATYEAKDSKARGALVALKTLALGEMRSWKEYEMFQREAAALRSLKNPAIPEYVDSMQVDAASGTVFVLVQKLAPGVSLQALRDSGVRLTSAQLTSMLRQLLDVLRYLGTLNPPLLHRDVKPENVIIEADPGKDTVKLSLVDFGGVNGSSMPGSAFPGSGGSSAVAATVVGTFGFMPPEAFGGAADVRSDLYSAGATMLFAISGRAPSEIPQVRLKIDCDSVIAAPQRLQLGNVYTVISKLLEPAPEDRYQSAEAALDALDSTRRRAQTSGTKMGGFVRGRRESGSRSDPGYGDDSWGTDDDDTQAFSRRRPRGNSSGIGGIISGFRGSRTLSKRQRQPAGSRVVLDRDPANRLFRVVIPARGLNGETASTGVFAVAWTGFVGFWTAGAITGGAPILGLFSLPFWFAGAKMAKRVADDLRSTTELVISAGGGEKEVYYFSLRVSDALGKCKEAKGDARDLSGAALDTTMYVNDRPLTSMILREGVRKHIMGESLELEEQKWLCSEINSFLEDAI